MAKDIKAVHDMLDYAKQLKRHTEGRRALHIRLSVLEKHLQEEHYRRTVAACFRSLKTDYGAASFALPNHDLLLIVKDAGIDTIDYMLNQARLCLKNSSFLRNIDAVQGTSDAFAEWFDLEADYDAFSRYIARLAKAIIEGGRLPASINTPTVAPQVTETRKKDINPETGLIKIAPQGDAGAPVPSAPQKKLKISKIEAPARDVRRKEFDPEMLYTLTKALGSVDVAGMLQQQSVMAILGIQAPRIVIVHHHIPEALIFSRFLETVLTTVNPWLAGYLADLVAERILASRPHIKHDNAIASSLAVTTASVLGRAFGPFNDGLDELARKNIILEFSGVDVTSNFAAYLEAREKLEIYGFKTSITGIDPRALAWIDLGSLQSDFLKVTNPATRVETWLNRKEEEDLIDIIERIGSNRIILDGCDREEDIILGQRLGLTMFQGDAVEPAVAV